MHTYLVTASTLLLGCVWGCGSSVAAKPELADGTIVDSTAKTDSDGEHQDSIDDTVLDSLDGATDSGGCSADAAARDASPSETGPCDPVGVGSWSAMAGPPSGFVGRVGNVAAWAGDRMIIWSGRSPSGVRLDDGAAYDIKTDTWRLLPISPLESRSRAVTVSTGKQLFIFGGDRDGATPFYDGALYDPSTEKWTLVPDPPVAKLMGTVAVWAETTGEVILVGELTSAAGAAYSLTKRSWRTIAAAPLKDVSAGVFAEGRLVVISPSGPAAKYDPVSDMWTLLTSTPMTASVFGPVFSASTGCEALFLSGMQFSKAGPCTKHADCDSDPVAGDGYCRLVSAGKGECDVKQLRTDTGWSYRPSTDTWTATASPCVAPPTIKRAVFPVSWWGAGRLWVWGGMGFGPIAPPEATRQGMSYDPLTQRWGTITTIGQPSTGSSDARAVWTGSQAIVWGGGVPSGRIFTS